MREKFTSPGQNCTTQWSWLRAKAVEAQTATKMPTAPSHPPNLSRLRVRSDSGSGMYALAMAASIPIINESGRWIHTAKARPLNGPAMANSRLTWITTTPMTSSQVTGLIHPRARPNTISTPTTR